MRQLYSMDGPMAGNNNDDTERYLKLRACIENLSRNPGADIVRYGWRRKDVISLGQGEGDAPTPDFIIKAAEKALASGKTFYAPVLGHPEARQEVSDYYARIYGLQVPTQRIFMTSSGTTAMHLALTAILDEGDEVIAVTPIWRNLLAAVELAQGRITEVALRDEAGQWRLDLEELIASCTPKTKAILIATPSNPTGWVMKQPEMTALLEFARKKGIWIISDEVYGRIVYDGTRAPSFLDVAEPGDRLFTVNSFSKAWAMTGWRLGWLVGPADAEEGIRDIALYNTMGPPSFTQYAAIEALRSGEPFIKQQLDLWRGNREYVFERFAQNGRIEGAPPEAAFYAFFRIKDEQDCLGFAKRLIDEASLSLAPGCAFGKVGHGYIRLCFAVSRPRLDEALGRLEQIIK